MKWVILCTVCMVGFAMGSVINKLDREKRSSGSTSSTDNEAPKIICPKVPTEFIFNGTSTVVNWPSPIGRDKDGEELTLQRTGPAPGSQFAEGRHIINYHVTDNNGVTASCEVVISVKVKSCGPVPEVEDGVVRCLGGNVYGATCFLRCKYGYVSQGRSISECSDSGQWSDLGPCVDISPPIFTDGCPEDIFVSSNNPEGKVVSWSDPVAQDNSNSSVDISSYPEKGSLFPTGTRVVEVTARDSSENTATCTFAVTVFYVPDK